MVTKRNTYQSLLAGAMALAAASNASAQTELVDHLVGDLGAALYATQAIVRQQSTQRIVLPYAYLDDDRFFARVDTLGVKTMPLGAGWLELIGRVSVEGFKPAAGTLPGIHSRSNPVPLGIGTQQRTPYGAFFLYGFHDLRSGGSLLEATYAARASLGAVNVYPQVGVERRSAGYVAHLYGVSAAEAAASGLPAYAPGASTVPLLGLAAEWPFAEHWSLDLQWRHKWLDGAIHDSPLVSAHSQNTGYLAVAYRFK